MSSEHITKQFDVELETVRAKVLKMGGLVEEQIEHAVESLHKGDLALADHVISEDHRVNGLEVGIDEDCTRIIARRQPTASDLRLVLAIIKTITDLERIGDEAEKIARMAKMIHDTDRLQTTRSVDLRHCAQLAKDMVGPEYDYDPVTNKIVLESKEHMRDKRGMASPDMADALAMTFAQTVARNDARTSRTWTGGERVARDVDYDFFK